MSGRGDGPAGRREVAYRLFAAEYDDADLEYSDSDEERAPNYVVTPTGTRVNRLFVVGVLTEVEPVSDDVLRARVVDPTGAFVVYAGQYQPEAVAFLEDADVPSFVAVTGKARTFQPEGSDRVFTSVRPESVTAVDGRTRDRWTVQAAEHTLARIATTARALAREERGEALAAVLREAEVDSGLADGIALALDHYGTSMAYLSALRELAVAAAEVVAGDREEVPALDLDPAGEGPVRGDLADAPAVAGTLSAGAALDTVPARDLTETSEEPADTEADTAEPTSSAEPPASAAPGTTETTAEPEAAEPAAEATEPESAEELGDFEADDLVADATEGSESAEDYDLDEEEREAVEAEFGTEFSTGSEVADPGEAGLETETAPPATEAEAEADSEPADEAPSEPAAPSSPEPEDEAPSGADEVDLEDAAIDAMAALDEGDGADRDAVVEAVVEDTGAAAEAVEAAIQDALMDGHCYEPADGQLKAI